MPSHPNTAYLPFIVVCYLGFLLSNFCLASLMLCSGRQGYSIDTDSVRNDGCPVSTVLQLGLILQTPFIEGIGTVLAQMFAGS